MGSSAPIGGLSPREHRRQLLTFFMITLSATTQDGLLVLAKRLLEDNGYVVEKWKQWERPAQIAKRLGIHTETLRRRLRKPNCPSVEIAREASGRIAQICSHARLDAFLTEGKNAK